MATIVTGKTSTQNSGWRDWLGVVASVGCAIHCAAMPFVIAYLPAWGLSFLADEVFHKWMALICFLIAIAAFVPGIRKHGNWLPISVASVGLTLITFAAFGLAGQCCPACEAASPTASVSHDCEQCETCAPAEPTSHCSHCDECSTCAETENVQTVAAVSSDANQNADKDWLSLVAPWITPIGGFLLVAAHLVNRRCGCLCGCC